MIIARSGSRWDGERSVRQTGTHALSIERSAIDQLEVTVEMLSLFQRDDDGYLPGDTHVPACEDGTLITLEAWASGKRTVVSIYPACGIHPLAPLVHQIEDAAGVAARR